MAFVRERQIYTSTRKGEEMKEIEIYVMTEGKMKYYSSHRSRKRVALTCPKQANLNDKRSRVHFDRLANTNFGIGDLHESLTYTDGHLPIDIAEGEANMNRYIARIRPIYEKAGIPFRYIWLTSYYTDSDDIPVRMHHHILLPGGVDRDLLEDMWRAGCELRPDSAGRKRNLRALCLPCPAAERGTDETLARVDRAEEADGHRAGR